MAVRNRIDLKSWDRASIGLPFFNRGIIVFGELLFVARDADASAREACRLALEQTLDTVQARAYAHFGAADPGAGRAEVEAARRAQHAAAIAVPPSGAAQGSLDAEAG